MNKNKEKIMEVGNWVRIKTSDEDYNKTFGGELGVIRKIFPSLGTAIVDIVNEHDGVKQIKIDMKFLKESEVNEDKNV